MARHVQAAGVILTGDILWSPRPRTVPPHREPPSPAYGNDVLQRNSVGDCVSATDSPALASRAGGPYTCKAGETTTLDGSVSTDLDGDVLTYQWTFHIASVVTLSGRKPTFTCPAMEGTFTVSLTVSDPGGLSDTDHSQLSIQPARGVAVDWTWLIVVAVAVVAVLLVQFLLIRRKKRAEETKEKEKASESPPKSSS